MFLLDGIGLVLIARPLVNALNNGVVGLMKTRGAVNYLAIIYSQRQAGKTSSGIYGW
jgi:hypothetical protein